MHTNMTYHPKATIAYQVYNNLPAGSTATWQRLSDPERQKWHRVAVALTSQNLTVVPTYEQKLAAASAELDVVFATQIKAPDAGDPPPVTPMLKRAGFDPDSAEWDKARTRLHALWVGWVEGDLENE